MVTAIGPGVLVAATGVGAGDLLTAGFGGSKVGLSLCFAALVGAFLKWFVNEGVARWQMATGTTLLEGWVKHLGRWIRWVFLIYLLLWSIVTGGALVNACGVAGSGLWPIGTNLHHSKMIWGVIHSLLGLVIVLWSGFKWFERIMAVCIAIMFIAVVTTATLSSADPPSLTPNMAGALASPTSESSGSQIIWILGMLGGVGGTVTILSYGYWIREAGRSGMEGMRACRLDLSIAYIMTAIFGVAMVVIGSRVQLAGKGAEVALVFASQLAKVIGPTGKWIFLIGFWGAVFSSLLGVWQSAPYLFSDFMRLNRQGDKDAVNSADLSKTPSYRIYLFAMALAPLPLLAIDVESIQLLYAVLGSLFMPLLAITLLLMNNRIAWVTERFRNRSLTNVVLVFTVLLFVFLGAVKLFKTF